ncbi:NADPH-dependent FMN reductase [Massilia sp. Se16.2.3]|uniref:NADPH-dependent FMN reductase n=1 Tax=Massilia sp. Se16.2.3 TaxID=2709303 RepID=UPI0015FEF1E5|nr:NADPH-dependent FMN reductase [Massilia sp. Se16.2.3]QNB00867.1 NAD(P)H-dependent oxidoreductase [Massilia sp. Se16.2.3]
MADIDILALSGSQRAASRSTALLLAAQGLAPPGVRVRIHEGHKHWPLFNPDLEGDLPPPVQELRTLISAADAVLIATPEYAHGVSGTIKNTLDWLVSHPGFAGKPVALFNPAYQSYHGDEALKETLRVMSADLIPEACVRIPVIGSRVELDAIGEVPAFRAAISVALQAIAGHVQMRRGPAPAG